MEFLEIWYHQRISFKCQIILKKKITAIKMLLNCFTSRKSKKNIIAFHAEIGDKWGQIATCASCEGCVLSKNC